MATDDDPVTKQSIKRRIQNEVDFREFNLQTRRAIESVMDNDSKQVFPLGMVCECSNPNCLERIELTVTQRAKIRQDPNYFIIAPDHQDPQLEVVKERHKDYFVVEKLELSK